MSGLTRVTDICVGIGTHNDSCCPHGIVGVIISGSPNSNCDNLPIARVPDVIAHSCPHCGIGVTLTGASNSFCNNIPLHRIGDLVFFTCGIGVTVTGSSDSIIEG